VRWRRGWVLPRNLAPIIQLGLFGWSLICIPTDFPTWIDSGGFLMIGGWGIR